MGWAGLSGPGQDLPSDGSHVDGGAGTALVAHRVERE